MMMMLKEKLKKKTKENISKYFTFKFCCTK